MSKERLLKIGESIGDKEGRLDICVASAGIIGNGAQGLEVTADAFDQVRLPNIWSASPLTLILSRSSA